MTTLQFVVVNATGPLGALRSLDGETGAAMTAYLDLVGNRLLDGFDIAEPSALELPDQLLRAIRTAATTSVGESDIEPRIAEIRAKVPAEHQESYHGEDAGCERRRRASS